MKRFATLALALMLLACNATATEVLQLEYQDVIDTTDTAAIRTDTAYSDWEQMTDGLYFNYAIQLMRGGGKDTDWVGDTYALALQMSWDRTTALSKIISLVTFNGDSVLIPDTTWSVTPKLLPPWWRLRMIHIDSIGVGEGDSALVNTPAPYTKVAKLIYLWRE